MPPTRPPCESEARERSVSVIAMVEGRVLLGSYRCGACRGAVEECLIMDFGLDQCRRRTASVPDTVCSLRSGRQISQS